MGEDTLADFGQKRTVHPHDKDEDLTLKTVQLRLSLQEALGREEALHAALAQAQTERDNVLSACKEAQADGRRLQEILTAVNAKNTNDECHPYHAWEPGGDNHLETLSCPVLIPAQWLRDLIADGGREAQAERDALMSGLQNAIITLGGVVQYLRVLGTGTNTPGWIADLEATAKQLATLLPGERGDSDVSKY